MVNKSEVLVQVGNAADATKIDITKDMVLLYGQRYKIDPEAMQPGILGDLAAWCMGRGELDAILCDSKESREMFAPIRAAYFKSVGKPEPEFSNVSWADLEGSQEKGE